MRNNEMLNRIYSAYNGYDVTHQEMVANSRQFMDMVLQSYSYHLDESDKYKYFTMFCAWVAASDGVPNKKEYDFFREFSGLNISFEEFKNIGIEIINRRDLCVEMRDLNINKFKSGTNYDYATNIIALCMCGSDGPINGKEVVFLNNYIRHPDYNPL